MKFEDIKNKKIELFVDNGIDKYRKSDDIKPKELVEVFMGNDGFFVLRNKDSNFVGYLDLADLGLIKNLVKKINDYKDKTIKELIDEGVIKLRTESIDSNFPLIDVLRKLDISNQNYFPILKEGILLGRISKKLLKEKINNLY